jgi:hypothetical protein
VVERHRAAVAQERGGGGAMNKYQKILTVVALIIFSAITSSLANETRDGNWWRAQQKQFKTVYVSGMIEGVCIGAANLTKGGPDATLVLVATVKLTIAGDNPGARVERLVDRMDQFYSHLGNRAISASNAFYIADRQLSGVPDEEIRKWIKVCQRASSAVKQ